MLADIKERQQVGMVQTTDRARLALEPPEVLALCVRQDLDRDLATKPRVIGPVDDAHAAGADRVLDLVRAEPGAVRELHSVAPVYVSAPRQIPRG